MTLLFAVDPGSTLQAAVRLRFFDGVVHYLDGALLPLAELHARFMGETYDAAILEVTAGYAYSPARVAEMLKTARNEGRLIEQLYACGLTPRTITASEARGEICRSSNASDEQIAIVVEALVQGAPKDMPKKQRQHLYDACLYGLAGLHRLGARFRLPAAAETALHMLRANERAASAKKGKATKAARQMGAMR